jgi:hypothetical protein
LTALLDGSPVQRSIATMFHLCDGLDLLKPVAV